MNQPNYEVKVDDSQEGAFDVEQVNMSNPPSSPYLEDEDGNGNSFDSVKGAAEDFEALPSSSSPNEDDNGSSFVSKCSSSWRRKGIIGIGIFVGTAIAAIVGLSVHSARNVQPQKSISMLSGGKAGKASEGPPYCPGRARACGETYTGGKVTLFEDLICNELEADPQPTIPGGANCAMTLEGDAELDCKGYMISQATPGGNDSAVQCETRTGTAKIQKGACQLYYYRGICLKNGAKAKNCHVQKFLDGIFVENGGEIKDSMVTRNRRGIFVIDEISGSSTKISKTTVQENASGIQVAERSSGNKISIDKVRSNNNVGLTGTNNEFFGNGMHLYGKEITVKDSEASGNHRIGIVIDGKGDTSVDLKGSITLRNNKQDGLTVDHIKDDVLSGVLNVDGVVDIYLNGRDGFKMNQDTELNVEVKKGSSLNSCQNVNKDIRNNGDGSYGNDGFTCDTTAGASGKAKPDCASCPECPAPSPSRAL